MLPFLTALALADTCPAAPVQLTVDLTVRCDSPGVWVFTALAPVHFPFPHFPANGLVIDGPARATLVDLAWTTEQADALMGWSAARGHPVSAGLVTHAHDDRFGGWRALAIGASVPVYATAESIRLAAARGDGISATPLAPYSLPDLSWFFPGAGHSPDNIAVWHRESGTLFSGCFIREKGTDSLGNLDDADRKAWPESVRRLQAEFPDVRRVVPGHGAVGGPELFPHTLALLAAR